MVQALSWQNSGYKPVIFAIEMTQFQHSCRRSRQAQKYNLNFGRKCVVMIMYCNIPVKSCVQMQCTGLVEQPTTYSSVFCQESMQPIKL